MTRIYDEIERTGPAAFPVLLLGETGVGKEHLASRLHAGSGRRGALVAVNCASIPADLLESEMFGIGRGVATGVEARTGKFQLADSGTLFLDEIGDLPPGLQAKLLRALDHGRIQPVGGLEVTVDARVVAATNQDLEKRVASGRFRPDLYYRLAGYVVQVPPLRERREDLLLLLQHFLTLLAARARVSVPKVASSALEALSHYPWPGNIRELEQVVRAAFYRLREGEALELDHLPPSVLSVRAPDAASSVGRLAAQLEAVERLLIERALRQVAGSQRRAARLLGVSRNGLAMKMKRLGLGRRA
jgi:two-component system NtrC family response regulator